MFSDSGASLTRPGPLSDWCWQFSGSLFLIRPSPCCCMTSEVKLTADMNAKISASESEIVKRKDDFVKAGFFFPFLCVVHSGPFVQTRSVQHDA